jgi:hypothetical protein
MDLNELMKNPEQIQNLISVLQALLPKEDIKIDKNNDESEFKTNSVIKTKSRKRSKEPSDVKNKFEQMSEFSMHKEDIAVDKALSKSPPVARTRDFEMINVTCRVCGKTETISPSLLFEAPSRYKCNNCSTEAG